MALYIPFWGTPRGDGPLPSTVSRHHEGGTERKLRDLQNLPAPSNQTWALRSGIMILSRAGSRCRVCIRFSNVLYRGGAKRCFSFCFVSFFVLCCRFVLVLVVVLVAFPLVVKVVAKPLLRLLRTKPPKPPPGATTTYETKRTAKRNNTKNKTNTSRKNCLARS